MGYDPGVQWLDDFHTHINEVMADQEFKPVALERIQEAFKKLQYSQSTSRASAAQQRFDGLLAQPQLASALTSAALSQVEAPDGSADLPFDFNSSLYDSDDDDFWELLGSDDDAILPAMAGAPVSKLPARGAQHGSNGGLHSVAAGPAPSQVVKPSRFVRR